MSKKIKTHADFNKALTDKWAAAKEQLTTLATDLAVSDAALVEAQRRVAEANAELQRATTTRTKAEKRFNTARARLGAE